MKALNCETLRHQHRITQFEYPRILVIDGLYILIRSKYNPIGTYVLRKTHGYGRLVGTLYNGHGAYAGQGSKPIPFFQFTTRLGRHIIATQTVAKVWHSYEVPHTIITKFWQKI